jgi:NADH-quinone oxidoreductase subunit N
LVQDNIKRLLAYSSIAHAGYVLVAFAAQPELGTSAVMFYTAAYSAMNVGAFAVVSHFANAGEKYLTLEDYAGLGRRAPMLAATLTFFLMSLIGIPITGGFFGKFYIFSAALKSNLVGLTVIGLLNSAVGAYYYLRVIVMMYMREPRAEVPVAPVPLATGFAIALCVLATFYLGVLPGRVLNSATQSARDLLPHVSASSNTFARWLGSSRDGPARHEQYCIAFQRERHKLLILIARWESCENRRGAWIDNRPQSRHYYCLA